jgi:hypothetical protein
MQNNWLLHLQHEGLGDDARDPVEISAILSRWKMTAAGVLHFKHGIKTQQLRTVVALRTVPKRSVHRLRNMGNRQLGRK